MKEKSRPRKVAETVKSLIGDTVCSLGYLLWDVEYKKEGSSWNLTVAIDRDGGISMEDCVAVNNAVSALLDEADPIAESYCLEVSSAGLERDLKEEAHFQKYLGERIRIRLFSPPAEGALAGKKVFDAKLLSYGDDLVSVLYGEEETAFPRNALAKASSIVDYEKIFKKE